MDNGDSAIVQPATNGAGQGGKGAQDEVTLLGLIGSVFRHRWLVAGVVALVLLVTIPFFLLKQRTYTATASFMPQSGSTVNSRLAGIAAQLGVSVGGGSDAASSPEFYGALLTTRTIAEDLLSQPFTIPGPRGLVTHGLDWFLQVDPDQAPPRRLAATMRALEGAIGVHVDEKTGIVSFSTTFDSPELARQVAARILDAVMRFNLETRQTQAKAEREFVQARRDQLRRELAAAETALRDFQSSNRSVEHSPNLQMQEQRLARDVAMRQAVFTSLDQAFEQARIEEVRNTPVVTIIERPVLPALPDPRGTVRKTIMAMIAGLILGTILAVVLDKSRQGRESPGTGWRRIRADLVDIAQLGRRPQRLLAPPEQTVPR